MLNGHKSEKFAWRLTKGFFIAIETLWEFALSPG